MKKRYLLVQFLLAYEFFLEFLLCPGSIWLSIRLSDKGKHCEETVLHIKAADDS